MMNWFIQSSDIFFPKFKKILVGDYNGNLNIFSYDSGELDCRLKKHEGEILHL